MAGKFRQFPKLYFLDSTSAMSDGFQTDPIFSPLNALHCIFGFYRFGESIFADVRAVKPTVQRYCTYCVMLCVRCSIACHVQNGFGLSRHLTVNDMCHK